MPKQTFDTFLFLIYFVYGLAFWGMGLTLALESRRISSIATKRIFLPLALFGVIHGTHEWLEAYLLQANFAGFILPTWLVWIRFSLLVSSFFFLLIYGIETFRQPNVSPTIWQNVGLVALFLYVAFILASGLLSLKPSDFTQGDLLDAFSRYLIAVPGAGIASMALQFQARLSNGIGKIKISSALHVSSIGFGIYALTQIVVRPLEFFPASIINTESFRLLTGLPIQFFRTVSAVIITVSLFQAISQMEKDRGIMLEDAQRQRVKALEKMQGELARREALKREMLRHVVQAQEEERARIARELHDETAQILAAISLDLAALHALVPGRSDCELLNTRLQEHFKEMSTGLYNLVHDLRPSHLDDLGLVPALKFLSEQDLKSFDLEIILNIQGKIRRLDGVIETVLFRVAQEALTNVIRHAQTKQAVMELIFRKQEIILSVADQGIGFNPNQLFPPPQGWGIAGMLERVEAVGGQLNIDSSPGRGTKVQAVISVFDLIP